MNTYGPQIKKELTQRQNQVLQFITSYTDDNGFPPSQREIAGHLNVSGTLPVMKHLGALEREGVHQAGKDEPGHHPGKTVEPFSFTAGGGVVRAGHLAPAIEDIQGYFSVDPMAVKGDNCFFLKVRGDSMINAGIFDGDLAMIRPQQTADNKDTVVAMIDGEVTLKWFYRESNHIRLQPANPDMDPIIIRPEDGELSIVGKVIGVYRRM